MDKFLDEIGDRLCQRRKQLRLTQEELAELIGVTPQMISTAELGKKAMRPENIVKICAALNISTDYLLTGKISEIDISNMLNYTKELTANQHYCLEEIIKNFVLGCNDNSVVLDR